MYNNTLKLVLKRVDPVKYAVVATLTYLAIILMVFVPIFLIASAVGATQNLGGGLAILGGGIFALVFVLIFYGVIIFIVTLLAAFILNFILSKVGGLPIDFEKTNLDVSHINDDRRIEK